MQKLAVALLLLSSAALSRAQVADTILVNGKIVTMDAADSIAEAVAIRRGRIIEVGAKEPVLRHKGNATRLIDLQGQTATPGLIDAHLHFAGVEPVYSIDLGKVSSIEEVLRLVRERVSKAQPGEWIQGQGWDEGKLAEHRYIYAADLDRIAPNNPVWLIHTTGHYGVANSVALRMAHISIGAQSPQAGTIDEDAKGRPTGVLKEEAAMLLVTKLIPPYSHGQLRDGYLTTMAALNKEGITGVKDPGMALENWSVYRELRDQNKLTIHLFALWRGGTSVKQTQAVVTRMLSLPKTQDDVLISSGVKLFMDGSGGARTAWMHKDWNKNFTETDTGNRGYPLTDPEIYRQQVRLIHDAGIHIGTHAIGDRAIDWVVDTYAEVLKDKPTKGLRHSIIHANIPSDHAITAMAALESQYDAGYPEAQAEFMYWIGDTYAGNFGPLFAPDAVAHLSGTRYSLGGWLGLPGDAVSAPLGHLGLNGAGDAQRDLWQAAVRNGGGCGYSCRLTFLYELGGASIVSRKPHWFNRTWQGCRYRHLGSRSIYGRHRSGERHAVYDDALSGAGCLRSILAIAERLGSRSYKKAPGKGWGGLASGIAAQ
jgi:predicted amidohydrolase YtcJ